MTSIGVGAFSGCSSLVSITIPNSVTSIGVGAFSGCSGLTSIKVDANNSEYDSRNNCNAIIETATNTLITGCKNTVIPNSVTSIEGGAFGDCSSLASITIPSSVTSIGYWAFSGCSGLTSIKVDANNSEYDSRNNCNAIIETATNKLITGCKNTSIPNSVTSIGYEAFSGCSSLASITIPNSVKSIGSRAFSDCSSLSSITIPNSVTDMGNMTFVDCHSLASITIGNSVTFIGDEAFLRCSNLASITIGNSVTDISYDAFWGCSNLASIEVEKNNPIFDSRNNCNAIILTATNTLITGCKNTSIPNSVTSIGYWAFSDCSSLASITIPNSVTSIGYEAFWGCTSLASITIPSSVTSIEDGAFEGCTSLASITIPNSVTSIGYEAFSDCSSLTSITIPNSVTSIGDYAFSDCSGLTSITIPNSVTSIGQYAFSGCSGLTSITIPKSVTSIGYSAFYDCDNLARVIAMGETPAQIKNDSFGNPSNKMLFVPRGSKSLYEQATGWKEFGEILEFSYIDFADAKTKSLCVANWDQYDDGEITTIEAEEITSLGTVFKKSSITSFNELQYFTGLTNIGEGAFSGSTVKEITLPEQITSLEKDAFLNCKSLVSLHLPAKVKSIEQNALSGCTAMTSITVDDANKNYRSIDGVLFSKNKKILVQFPAAKATSYDVPEGTTIIARDAFYQSIVESITLPTTLKELVYDAFGYSKKLVEMELPEGLEIIGDYAFDNCTALKKLWFPTTITSIGQRMCNGCKAITDVYSANNKPFAINENNFNSAVYTNATLHVPAGTKEKYAALDGWKNFANIAMFNSVYCGETLILSAGTTNISINLYTEDGEKYNGYQFDLFLPLGFSLAKRGNAYLYEFSDRYTGNMQLGVNDLGNGHYRLMAFSLDNTLITGTDGEILSLALSTDDSLPAGTYEGKITDFKLSTEDGRNEPLPNISFDIVISEFVLGDANHDREVNVSDVMLTVNKVLGKVVANFYEKEADVNADGELDVADVMGIVRIVLNSGSSSAPQNHRVDGIGSMTCTSTSDGYALSLDHVEVCTALQMIVTLPSGSSLKDVTLKGNPSHMVRFQRIEDSKAGVNQYKVVVWSADGSEFANTDNFLSLMVRGNKDLDVSSIQLTNEEFETILLPDAGMTTSIGDKIATSTVLPSENSLYNLQGQKVSKPHKGVFIRDNKKVIVK